MDLITVIIIISMIISIVNKAMKAQKNTNEKANENMNVNKNVNTNVNVDSYAKQNAASQKNTMQKSTSQSMTKNKTANTSGKVLTEQAAGQSTTDYLAQKAYIDKQEHEEERRKDAIEAKRFSNGSKSAERLLLGDSVPNGRQVIICGYCGAENLVPENTREKYNCYFCREPL